MVCKVGVVYVVDVMYMIMRIMDTEVSELDRDDLDL